MSADSAEIATPIAGAQHQDAASPTVSKLGAVRRFFRSNGLSITLVSAFLVIWLGGQAVTCVEGTLRV